MPFLTRAATNRAGAAKKTPYTECMREGWRFERPAAAGSSRPKISSQDGDVAILGFEHGATKLSRAKRLSVCTSGLMPKELGRLPKPVK